MAVSEDDLTLEDLDAIYPQRAMDPEKANNLKGRAVNFTNQVVGGSIAYQSEIEGPEEDFALLVWAHFCALREGESSSESQQGSSVSYSVGTSNLSAMLSETRWGRMARSYLRGEQSIGIVRGSARFRG